MKNWTGKKAVVTGGASGIGRGIALALADQGADVAVADLELEPAQAVARELRARGVDAHAFRTDVTDSDSLAALADDVYRRFGACDLLSNNAGVAFQGKLEEASEDDWQWVMSVNLHGLVNACTAFVARMRAQRRKCYIVNNASLAGLVALDFLQVGVYTVSKYAAVGYSESLHAELAPAGIHVAVLCPGMVRSNLAATSARNRPDRFGGPMPEPPDNMTPELEAIMMEPEEVGRIVLRGLTAGRLYIITHPAAKPLVTRRYERLLADFEAEAQLRDGPC